MFRKIKLIVSIIRSNMMLKRCKNQVTRNYVLNMIDYENKIVTNWKKKS